MNKNIVVFLLAQGISLFGTSLVSFAITWYVTLQTQSGLIMALFTLSTFIPMLIISPFAGVWADKYSKKLLINIADISIAITTLIIIILFALGIDSILLLLVCNIVRGFGQGIQKPCVNSFIPEIVTDESKLLKINGFNQSINAISELISPAISGLLLSCVAITNIFMIDVITAIISVSLLVFGVKTRHIVKENKNKNTLVDIKEGLRYINNHNIVKRLIIYACLLNIFSAPAILLTPLQVVTNFGNDYIKLSLVQVLFVLGTLFGSIIIALRKQVNNKIKLIILAYFLFGIGIILLGFTKTFVVFLFISLVAGMAIGIAQAPTTTLLQELIDNSILGRIFSIFIMGSTLSLPIGILFFGAISQIININYIMIISGILIVLLIILMNYDKILNKSAINQQKY